jgi:hypothetical protein
MSIPTKIEEIRTGNFFAPMLIPFTLADDLATGLAKAKENATNLNMMDALGASYLIEMSLSLPFSLP